MKHEKTIETRLEQLARAIGSDDSFVQSVMSRLETSSDTVKQKPTPTFVRRFIMKRFTKFAAAAILLIAILFGINHFSVPIDGAAIAFADVVEAMNNVSWLYQKGEDIQGDVIAASESWFGFSAQVQAVKLKDGKRMFWDFNQHKFYEYDPENNHITIRDTTEIQMPYNGSSHTMMLEGMHQLFVERGATVYTELTEYNGQTVQLQRYVFSVNEQNQKLDFYINPKTKLLIAAHISAEDKEGKMLKSGKSIYSYPSKGPLSIYDLDVPENFPIIMISEGVLKSTDPALIRIDQAESWPEPEILVRKYWNARNQKNYEETRLYWPNSEHWDEKIYEMEDSVEYVFGDPVRFNDNYTHIPYDAKEYYEQNHKYRLKMVLSNLGSQKGRYYIISGN